MSDTSTVTEWIERLKQHDDDAVGRLWTRYIDRLIRLARSKLGQTPRRGSDEEDVVISAFDSFVRGARQRRFSQLRDRTDLWQVLVLITERKAISQRRRELSQKRGGGRVRGESALLRPSSSQSHPLGVEAIAAQEPTPEFAFQVTERFQQLLTSLGDDELRQIALAKMEGYTNQESAGRMDLTLRTVERRLRLIRSIWQEEAEVE